MEKAIEGLMDIYGLNAEQALHYAEDAKEALIQNYQKATPAQILKQASLFSGRSKVVITWP